MDKEHKKTLLFVVNVDWFFLSHRLSIAKAAQNQNYIVHIATSLTDRLSELEQNGLIVHPLVLQRGGTRLKPIWQEFRQMVKIMRSVQPDIVHLVTIKPVLLGGLAARLTRIPALVAAFSGLGFIFTAKGIKANLRRILIGWLYRIALGHKNRVAIFQNNDDRVSMMHLTGLESHQAILIRGSGIDLAVYKPSSLPEGRPIVMLAARLLVDKGIREFVAAAKWIKKNGSNQGKLARFVLVGDLDPPNPASLTEADLDQWKKEGHVEIWGYQRDMASTLAQSRLVVLPSYREGLPKVLIEAAACGRAVITTDVPGCRDAIEPDITGLLVPARNTIALANAIERLLEKPEQCARMGRAGRMLAEKAFDIHRVVDQHLAVYQRLIETIDSNQTKTSDAYRSEE